MICDDGSKDETLDIIEQVAHSSSVQIRVIQNKKNIGFLGISCRLFLSVQEMLFSYPIKMMYGGRIRSKKSVIGLALTRERMSFLQMLI